MKSEDERPGEGAPGDAGTPPGPGMADGPKPEREDGAPEVGTFGERTLQRAPEGSASTGTGTPQAAAARVDGPVDSDDDPFDVIAMDSAQIDRICLFNLLSASADTIFFKDLASRFIRVSQSQANLTGADSPAAMLGRTDFDYFSAEHATEAFAYEQEIIRTGESVIDLHEWNVEVGDKELELSSTKQPLRDFSGRIIGTFGITRDITTRKSTERQLLAKTEELDRIGRELRTLLDSSPDPMARMDPEMRYVYVNPAAETLAGLTADEMIGHTSDELGFPHRYVVEWENVLRRALDTGVSFDVERDLVLAGTRRYLHSRLVPELDETGAVVSVLVVSHDLTERKRVEDALAEQAVHDPLTRLANRVLLVDRTNQALARMRRVTDDENEPPSGRVGVLFLDLDRFKVVNDSLGHAAGDALLVAVAARLREAARGADVVARFGGDEFAVLVERLPLAQDAAALADKITQALTPPFRHAGQEFYISASIGIACTVDPATDAEALLRDADAAMYQVKAQNRGSGGYLFFTDAVRERAVSRLAIENDLRLGLERGEFRLVYEPVYALRERRLVGVEALIRWQHPERGLLAPASFIEVAEDCGQIVPIGRWVLEDACRRLARWNRILDERSQSGGGREAPTPLTMAVNLSVRQISDPAFVGEVAEVLDRYGLEPHQVCMEITETAVHDAPLSASVVLKGLSALGVRIALDDFGTGYSSLRHLRHVSVDILKIDRMFVSGLGQAGDDRAIVAAVIGMARALGMATVGEGIETVEQYEALTDLGCDHGQGYLMSQPLTPEAFEAAYLGQARRPLHERVRRAGWRSRTRR